MDWKTKPEQSEKEKKGNKFIQLRAISKEAVVLTVNYKVQIKKKCI